MAYTLENTAVEFCIPTHGDMFVRLTPRDYEQDGSRRVLFEAKNEALTTLVREQKISIITKYLHQSVLRYFNEQQEMIAARRRTKIRLADVEVVQL